MRRIFGAILVIFFGALSEAAFPYEVATHENLSENALEASALGRPGILTSFGLKEILKDEKQQAFPNSKGTKQSINDLFRTGAKFEDNFPRPLNHFFDPITGKGLGLGSPSPDWALEDQGGYTSQDNSYKDARGYFYDALAKAGSTRAERDADWGKLFQSLGQIIHHLQDMAQPQHVRNDAHCDAIFPCLIPGGLVGLYGPSLYEKYTQGVGNLPFTGYGPVMFPTPRHFWTDTGQGLAEFSNRNFVSAGTNYQLFNDNPVPNANYFEPIPSGFGPLVPIEELFNERGETTTLTGLVGFVENEVYDRRTGIQTTNKRSASLSIYDQDLSTYGVAVPYTDPITGQTWLTDRLFTLNRFNFQAVYPHLIPKAVAYSAGLIDYFFRGTLEITLPDEGVYGIVDHSTVNEKDTHGFTRIKMKLKNATPDIVGSGGNFPQDMTGGKLELVAKFRRNTCYQPDLTGEFNRQTQATWNGQCGFFGFRSPDEEIVVSKPIGNVTLPADPNALPKLFTFEFDPAKPIPINATDLYLQVVYRGPLGAEADAVAVATNDVYEPTYFTYLNNTDYFPANGKYYKVYKDPYDPQNPYTPELLAQVDLDSNGTPDVAVDPVTLSLMRLRLGASTKDVAVAASLPPARQWRVTYLTDQSPHKISVLGSGVVVLVPLQQASAETVQDDAQGKVTISPFSRKTRGFIGFNLIYYVNPPYGALPPVDDVDTLDPLKDLTLFPVGVIFNPE